MDDKIFLSYQSRVHIAYSILFMLMPFMISYEPYQLHGQVTGQSVNQPPVKITEHNIYSVLYSQNDHEANSELSTHGESSYHHIRVNNCTYDSFFYYHVYGTAIILFIVFAINYASHIYCICVRTTEFYRAKIVRTDKLLYWSLGIQTILFIFYLYTISGSQIESYYGTSSFYLASGTVSDIYYRNKFVFSRSTSLVQAICSVHNAHTKSIYLDIDMHISQTSYNMYINTLTVFANIISIGIYMMWRNKALDRLSKEYDAHSIV